jgi:hypothetical protein
MPLHSADTAQPNECTGIKLCREGSRPPKGRGPADFDGDATLSITVNRGEVSSV